MAVSFELVTRPTDQVPLSQGRVSEVIVPQEICGGPIRGGTEPSADLKWRP